MLDKLDPSVPPLSYVAFWLLMFISFLLGWFLAILLLRSRYRKKTDTKVESAKRPAFEPDSKEESITTPPTEIKAVQTRGRSGAAILSDSELVLRPLKPKKEDDSKLQLNFDSFGKADESQKDDLKKISGIGPFIEKKLNSIGIYTFSQISRFTDDDIETVTALIEFFPGRIKRDDWKGQAKSLSDTKDNQEV